MKTSTKTWIDAHSVIAFCREEAIEEELNGNSSYNRKLRERIAWLNEQIKNEAPKLAERRAKLARARIAKQVAEPALER